jgi:hypothetical protein
MLSPMGLVMVVFLCQYKQKQAEYEWPVIKLTGLLLVCFETLRCIGNFPLS